MAWTVGNIPAQAGRLAVITGATSGIGFHAALELARKGAAIILPARSDAKGEDAVRRIRAQVPGADLTPALLDLASLGSIRRFAALIGDRFPGHSIDLLVNNAGVMALPSRVVTEDGFETQIATNFLGPFALTALLFPHLKPVAGTRIVTLASVIARRGRIDLDDLQSERGYDPIHGAYAQSKLADLIFALELDRRLRGAGSPIASVAAHPGIAMTNLSKHFTGFYKWLAPVLIPLIGQDARQAALPELFAATSPDAQSGGYYGPHRAGERKGFPAPARRPAAAGDEALARKLWEAAERLTAVAFEVGKPG